MKTKLTKNRITRFLLISFIGLIIFSILVFTVLGIYMSRKSTHAVYDVGNLYMKGMGEQLSKHFETSIKLRFEQMEGLAEVVSSNNSNKDKVYQELSYRAKVRNFDYLALCSNTGEFEMIYGKQIKPCRPIPFLDALNRNEKRVVIGEDADGKEVILFGVSGKYPMKKGKSIGLIGAVPIEYVSNTLSLDSDSSLLYCHIIRTDGTFVIDHLNSGDSNYFTSVLKQYKDSELSSANEYLGGLEKALKNRKIYFAPIEKEGYQRQIYGLPMPYSEWYLLMVMPYGSLDQVLNNLNNQRTLMTIVSCGIVLALMLIIFFMYSRLTHKQLKELEKAHSKALEATKAKSEFLSNMSHDIRTPMNAIVGMTSVALNNIQDNNYVENCLKKIALSGKHLLGLINDILDMSKIESGKITLSSNRVSLKEIIEELVGIVQPQIKAKNQTFDIHIDNITAEEILCDSVRLNQVLLNLLSNAIKYTLEGGAIELSVREDKSPKGEKYVRIHTFVKDNGIGMTPEFLEKIFDSYTRADNTRVHKTEGAGLGMAITKYIVDAMDGTIEVKSEPEKGTEFHIILDFEKAASEESDMMLPAWNMLVVDDDKTLCETAVQTLKSIGINADWVLNGEDAIKMVMQHHSIRDDYQIILLDWKLPNIDGLQTAREIRKELGNDIPILLISAYDWSEFEIDARNSGINGFISKPLFKSTLYYGLKKYMISEDSNHEESNQYDALSGRRILIAEDNELNWEVACELLSELNVKLEWAENGQICLEKFKNSEIGYYDAILMDIRMPFMNGYEATQAIRALNRSDSSEIPIIAMTADAFTEDINNCLEAGMNAHIAKPININEVARLLLKFII